METPPFEQKSYDETTTVFGNDEEGSVVKRRRKRRSLGRRVSFAEAPAYHIFTRDDEYVSPSHDVQDAQGSAPQNGPKRRSPRLASKRQAGDSDDKENWLPVVANHGDDRMRRRGLKPLRSVEQTIVSPASRPPSWHPAKDTSSLAGDDGDICFVDVQDTSKVGSFMLKDPDMDEEVTFDSTTFTFKLSQLHNLKSQSTGDQDMVIESAPPVKKSLGLRTGRESPAPSSGENDMSMSFTMIKPIVRPKLLELQSGHVDGNTDMSITMQVPRKQSSFLGLDARNQAEVIEILKASLSAENGDHSSLGSGLSNPNPPKLLKSLGVTRERFSKPDKENFVISTAPGTGQVEKIVNSATYAKVRKEKFTLAAITEDGGSGKLITTAICAESVKDIPITTVSHPEEIKDTARGPAVCREYEEELPGSPASYGRMDATATMDVTVSPTSASALASRGCQGSASEADHIKSSTKPGIQELVQQEGRALKLPLTISPEKEACPVTGNEEKVITTGSEDSGKENTITTESEKGNLIVTEQIGKGRGYEGTTAITAANTKDITITNTTDFADHSDRLSAPAFSVGLEKVNPGLSATYQSEEATLTMDMSVSPPSTASLAYVEWKRPAGELERSVTMDIPSLQDLVQEEEDEDMVTDMKMDTEVFCSRPRMSSIQCNSLTEGSHSFRGSHGRIFEGQGLVFMEKDLDRFPCFSEKASQLPRDEVDQDRTITLAIPRLADIIREEEEEDDRDMKEQVSARQNVTFPSSLCEVRNIPSSDGDFTGSITAQVPRCSDLLAADSVSPDRAPAWNKSRSSWVAPPPSFLASTEFGESEAGRNICATPSSDSGMEIVDDCGELTLYSRDVASVEGPRSSQMLNLEGSSAQLSGKGEHMHLTGVESSPNLRNMTPTSDSGESMDVVGDTTNSTLLLSSVRLSKIPQLENRTPTDCSGQMEIVGEATRLLVPSDSPQILRVAQGLENKSSDWSVQSMDIVPEAANVVLPFGSARCAKVSQDSDNRTPIDGADMMVVDDVPNPNLLPKLIPIHVSKSVGNISPTANSEPSQAPLMYLSPVRHSPNEQRVRDYRSYTPSPTPRTHDAKELINSVLQSAKRSRLASMGTVDKTLTLTGQTTDVQQDSLSILRERLRLQLNSAKKVQLASGNQPYDDTQCTKVEQVCSLADQSLGLHFRDNISVEEFFRLAEVQFCAKPERSSDVTKEPSSLQAYEVNTIDDALRHFFLFKPRLVHMKEACNVVQESLRTSEARLEEALTAPTPSLFSRFQKVGAGEKQRLKEHVNRLQTKCRSVIKGDWLNFRLALENDWRVQLCQSKEQLQSQAQGLREGNRFLEENYKQILNLQARISSKALKVEEYPSDKAAPKADEEKAQNKLAQDKIKYLKEQLVDVNLFWKSKLEKLLKRTQITEEALRTSKERQESSQCRLHDLQTNLAENVRRGHSQAAGIQIAASPVFYVKEMMNKVSLLKALQGGWQVMVVGRDMVEFSYTRRYLLENMGLLKRRLVVAKSADVSYVTKSTWELDYANIELMFSRINAVEAFEHTLMDRADAQKSQKLRSCIQATRFLVNNFLVLMEEVGRCQKVTKAFATGVLVVPRFLLENDEHMQLEIKFMDCVISAKFIITLDMTCAQLNGYPFGAMPSKVDLTFCPQSFSHKLTSAALEDALAGVEPGYHRVERVCAAVGSFLASVRN